MVIKGGSEKDWMVLSKAPIEVGDLSGRVARLGSLVRLCMHLGREVHTTRLT